VVVGKFLTLLLAVSWAAHAELLASEWELAKARIEYHVRHKFKSVTGHNQSGRGKGRCQAGQCEFLVATPVKDFSSGNGNRDLHLLEVTRANQFPVVSARVFLPQNQTGPKIKADVELEFAGQTKKMTGIQCVHSLQGRAHHISARLKINLTDFKVERPTLLTLPIDDEVLIDIDMVWQPH
jgi:hypothetical protein